MEKSLASMLFEALVEMPANVQKLRIELLRKKLVTVFEDVESTNGEHGYRVGTKRSATIYWDSDFTKESLEFEIKTAESMKKQIQKLRYDILAKVTDTSEFCEYLKLIGEWDPKRGPMGYNIKEHIKVAKSYITDLKYSEEVIIPLFKTILGIK